MSLPIHWCDENFDLSIQMDLLKWKWLKNVTSKVHFGNHWKFLNTICTGWRLGCFSLAFWASSLPGNKFKESRSGKMTTWICIFIYIFYFDIEISSEPLRIEISFHFGNRALVSQHSHFSCDVNGRFGIHDMGWDILVSAW